MMSPESCAAKGRGFSIDLATTAPPRSEEPGFRARSEGTPPARSAIASSYSAGIRDFYITLIQRKKPNELMLAYYDPAVVDVNCDVSTRTFRTLFRARRNCGLTRGAFVKEIRACRISAPWIKGNIPSLTVCSRHCLIEAAPGNRSHRPNPGAKR